jgi:hypothetical protein
MAREVHEQARGQVHLEFSERLEALKAATKRQAVYSSSGDASCGVYRLCFETKKARMLMTVATMMMMNQHVLYETDDDVDDEHTRLVRDGRSGQRRGQAPDDDDDDCPLHELQSYIDEIVVGLRNKQQQKAP